MKFPMPLAAAAAALFVLSTLEQNVTALVQIIPPPVRRASTTFLSHSDRCETETGPERTERSANLATRRASFFVIAASMFATSLLPTASYADAETLERGGVKLTPFNSLAYQYRGGSNPVVGVSTLDEPSVSYGDFLSRLGADEVAFVEFRAPNGDVAYVTFKSKDDASSTDNNGPIRIGDGYPMEDPGGWSSPAFVVKAVAKKGVPYKFVVPGLAAYN